MKYVAVLALGILTGLAFSHLPPYPIFRDFPGTDKDWKPRMSGAWSDEDRAAIDRYFNGGKDAQ